MPAGEAMTGSVLCRAGAGRRGGRFLACTRLLRSPAMDTTHIYEAARTYADRGWPIIPLRGKAPAVRGWQQWVADEANVLLWFGRRGCNIGLRPADAGYTVVDTDTEEADAWVRAHLPETPMTVRTGSGSTHRYYAAPPRKEIRNSQGWRAIPGLDVRGSPGPVVLPPSIHPDTGRPYMWVGDIRLPAGLPGFSPSWVYRRTRRRVRDVMEADPGDRVRRARAYVAKIEGAVSGQGGHNKTFRVACILRQKFGLSVEEAWPLFQEWNATCQPEWSDRELAHKLEDAGKRRG